MNKSKKLVFAFFISASLMNAKCLLHNSVHAAGIMPNPQDASYVSDSNIFTKYGYKGQCTWFTYGRVLEKLSINLPSEFYGNAVDWWYANAKDKVYSYGSEPKANSIVVWGGGNKGYGHVAFVEKVEGDTVYFNEGNFNIRGAYDGQLKSLSKEEIKNRGNLFLKGYIYVSSSSSNNSNSGQTNNSNTNSNNTQSEQSKSANGLVNISSYNSTLNVRSSANGSSGVIGSLKKGSSVNIVAVSGDWYKIKYNSSYGYVSSKYISLGSSTNSSSNTQPEQSKSASGLVNISSYSSTLNVRSSASSSSGVIGALKKGSSVNVVAVSSDWYKIKYNSSYGYVSSKYISLGSSQPVVNNSNTTSTAPVTNLTSNKFGVVNLNNQSSYLNLRNNPSGNVIGSLPSGTKLQILGTSGNWYKVNSNGTVGYVSADYVSISSGSTVTTTVATNPQPQTSGKVGTVTLSNKNSTLNLRSAPWTGRVLSELAYGSKVQILSSSGRWYKVQAGSTVGFVHSDYIAL
ncbi:SH3 domain-containing protein [Clostridium scatologenes]|uniref:N-acetylmuramoyl-L-alanine amidase n=1 Tax=Clostridium scatologenes TaxID=1548 RepID=A0A0E3GSK8_CLOSL|nr:SH3 domain-containing protein [Clostridium scatologenes]AKA72246.1 CHAP domain containing protein [Clostridium scatologenes]